MRLEDPFNRYYRYPLARRIVQALMKTPVSPDQVSLAKPLLGAIAGFLVTFDEPRHLAAAALLFELRSLLDCVDGALARAKRAASPAGRTIDAVADGLSIAFLYAGIFWHFRLHPPPAGPWSAYASTDGLLLLALFQAVARTFGAAHYALKYASIFERGSDQGAELLRRKMRAIGPSSSIFHRVDVFVGRMEYLSFEHRWLDLERRPSPADDAQVKQLIREQHSPLTRLIGALWSVSNGDAFLSMLVLTLLADQLWLGQIFFATVGVAWIVGVILLNGWFVRGATRRAKLAVA